MILTYFSNDIIMLYTSHSVFGGGGGGGEAERTGREELASVSAVPD